MEELPENIKNPNAFLSKNFYIWKVEVQVESEVWNFMELVYHSRCSVPQRGFSNIAPDGFVLTFPGQFSATSLSGIKSNTYTSASFYVTVIISLQVIMVLALSA